MNKILYCFIVLVFLIADAWADGVEVEVIKGNTVIPVQNHNVRMLSEEVKMLPAEKQNEIEISRRSSQSRYQSGADGSLALEPVELFLQRVRAAKDTL